MGKLIDRAGVGLEVSEKFLVLSAPLKRRETKFLIRASPPLPSLRHGADRFSVRRGPSDVSSPIRLAADGADDRPLVRVGVSYCSILSIFGIARSLPRLRAPWMSQPSQCL